MIPVFIGTTFLIFAMVWYLPGDPFAGRCGAAAVPDPAYVALMREQFNLDDPLIVQYLKYLGNAAHRRLRRDLPRACRSPT